MTASSRGLRAASGVALLVLGLGGTGCGVTMTDLPLPGSAVSGDTITVTADFDEALNLAQGGQVRVNGVDSGKVQEVTTDDFRAKVKMTLVEDAQIREGATARLRYQTPLGELFIEIINPSRGQLLTDGATIPNDHTETAPTVEDALSQASLLINGGNLGSLQTVTEELNTILNGREDNVKALLRNASGFMTEANATTSDIDVALRSLDSVARTLDRRKRTIRRALREIEPAARVLREATPEFTELLAEVEKFAVVANRVVGLTRRQLLTVIRQAGPVMAEYTNLGDRYALSLSQLVRLGRTLDNVVPNDYIALQLTARFDTLSLDGLSLDDLNAINDLLGGILDPGLIDGLFGLGVPELPRDNRAGGNRTDPADDPVPDLGILGQSQQDRPSGLGGLLGLLGRR